MVVSSSNTGTQDLLHEEHGFVGESPRNEQTSRSCYDRGAVSSPQVDYIQCSICAAPKASLLEIAQEHTVVVVRSGNQDNLLTVVALAITSL